MNVNIILFIISEEISFGTDFKLEMPKSMFKNGPKMWNIMSNGDIWVDEFFRPNIGTPQI